MPSKPIRISSHARFEMRRRGIKRADVIATIRHAGQVLPSIKGRQIHQSKIGRAGRMLLRVIVREDAGVYHVVTVYKTSKIAKYLRTP
jgi:Domain of unknown function (DUF4258)